MLYYKVKPQYDNYCKNPKIHDSNIYVANELYTEKEVQKQNLNRSFLEPVEVSKKKVYWFFGARFAAE